MQTTYKGIVFERSIGVELKLPSAYGVGTILNFNDVPQLRGAYVQGIEAFTDTQVTKTFNQTSVIEAAAADDILTTWVEGSENKYENMPYYTLISSLNGGLIRSFSNLRININKCFVYMGGTTAGTSKAMYFQIYYSQKPL